MADVAELEARLGRLETALAEIAEGTHDLAAEVSEKLTMIGAEVDAVGDGFRQLAAGEVGKIPDVVQTRCRPWLCPHCSTRLGTYHPDVDMMSVKMKDAYLSFHPGPGGWVRTICRSCGRIVQVNNEESPQAATA